MYSQLETPYESKTGSDWEVILPLYSQYGASVELPKKLRGVISFILYDKSKDLFLIVRDHIGWANDGSIFVASKMKSLSEQCMRFQAFPPGHLFCTKGPDANTFVRWYTPAWAPKMLPGLTPPKDKYNTDNLRVAFEKAIVCCMMSDVPWGVLLSGGLDSSLVDSIYSRHILRRSTLFPKLHLFTVGLEGSPDLIAAKRVADYLGTIHHA